MDRFGCFSFDFAKRSQFVHEQMRFQWVEERFDGPDAACFSLP
jgi:hypothetical protein